MPPANRTGDQFDTLVVVRHKPVLEDSLKPSRLCRVSGRNGGQFTLPDDGLPYPITITKDDGSPINLRGALEHVMDHLDDKEELDICSAKFTTDLFAPLLV